MLYGCHQITQTYYYYGSSFQLISKQFRESLYRNCMYKRFQLTAVTKIFHCLIGCLWLTHTWHCLQRSSTNIFFLALCHVTYLYTHKYIYIYIKWQQLQCNKSNFNFDLLVIIARVWRLAFSVISELFQCLLPVQQTTQKTAILCVN